MKYLTFNCLVINVEAVGCIFDDHNYSNLGLVIMTLIVLKMRK